MAEKNFFLVNRSLLAHWLWQDKPFSKGQAWIDLIALANYADTKVVSRGEVVTCKRGDVNFSILYLSERWGWSRGKTARFLKLLESDSMVKINATTNRTTITIENYERFQTEQTTDATTGGQQAEQRSVQWPDIIKEGKRKRKKDKEYIDPALGEFGNVLLSEEELEKLTVRFPYDWQERIERLSAYMQSRGKRYKSHYATILTWERNEKKQSGDKEDFLDL